MSNYINSLKFLVNQNKNTKKNFNVDTYNVGANKIYRILYTPNNTKETFVNGYILNNGTFHINYGKTRQNLRRRGIGTQMRALMTLAAKKHGIKLVNQISSFNNSSQRKNYSKPPSSYIMQKLGFNQQKQNSNTYYHKYNFNKKSNKNINKLVRYAYRKSSRNN